MQRHSENRRQYSSAYTMSSLVSYESYVDECADLFSQRLHEIAKKGMFVDMGHWLQCYAFDVIGLITYSKRLGFLDAGEDISNVMSVLDQFWGYATLVGIFPSLHPWLYAIKSWLAGGKGTGREYVQQFTEERVKEHPADQKKTTLEKEAGDVESQKTAEDFLTKFFAKLAENPKTFTQYHLITGLMSVCKTLYDFGNDHVY